MSEWREYVLEDVIEKFIDYRGKTPNKTESGVPLVTAKVVKAGKILPPTEFISLDDYDTWMTRGFPEVDDIVLTTEAPLGEVALIKDKNVALAQRIITLRGKKEYVFNPFLKYYFQNDTGQHELQSRASGTTVFGIKASVLKKVPVELPSLSEQKSIAAVLSSLDDKIDLLHRQNQTLEAMAATLFRQWFMEKAQEDWEVGQVKDLVDVLSGFAFKSSSFSDVGMYRLITIKAVQDGYLEVAGANKINEVPVKMPDYCNLVHGDILLSLTGNVGRCCLVDSEKLLLNQRVSKLQAKNKRDWAFVYVMFRQPSMRQLLEEMAKGTAQANLSPIEMANMEMLLPPAQLLGVFSVEATPLLQKVLFNKNQIKTLSTLRDTLLPKLMSGAVRVAC